MSHTGSVIHPSQSPALIRMITSGYKFCKVATDNGQDLHHLLFRKPIDRLGATAMRRAQDRLIPYVGKKKFHYSDAVTFDLFKFNQEENGCNAKEIHELQTAIPDYWIDQIFNEKFSEEEGNNFTPDQIKKEKDVIRYTFEFSYEARDARDLPKRFVLNRFFCLIENLEKNKLEEMLNRFDTMKEFPFQNPEKMRIKRDRDGRKRNDPRKIWVNMVEVLEVEDFHKRKNCLVDDLPSDVVDYHAVVEFNGEHPILEGELEDLESEKVVDQPVH